MRVFCDNCEYIRFPRDVGPECHHINNVKIDPDDGYPSGGFYAPNPVYSTWEREPSDLNMVNSCKWYERLKER